jgi:hypothetical protein
MADILKVDLKRKLRHLYNPSPRNVAVIDIPLLNYLMLDGSGNPETSSDYSAAVSTLYAVSYALKFMVQKSATPVNYTVLPLEGLWWSNDMSSFIEARRHEWQWTMMIMQPEFVTRDEVELAIAATARKRDLPALTRLRFEELSEGLCAQIMHIGPYANEGVTVARLHDYLHSGGHHFNGKHHEIYLNDPRKTAPARIKTILRQPFA